jgi:hypothetical protein
MVLANRGEVPHEGRMLPHVGYLLAAHTGALLQGFCRWHESRSSQLADRPPRAKRRITNEPMCDLWKRLRTQH